MGRSSRHGAGARVALAFLVGMLTATLASPVGVGAAAPASDDAMVKAIVTLKAKPGAAAKTAIKQAGGKVNHTYTLIDGMAVTVPAKSLPGLRKNKLVKSIELDGTVTILEPLVQAEAIGDLEYDNAWGVTRIGSKAVHDAGIKGQGVKVAVIDTGIDYVHDVPPAGEPPVVDPEFLSVYQGGFNFLNGTNDPMDDNGHGTHVAGILAAEKNGYLVVGVAPQVDLYALKILDANGSGDVSNLILALQWAVTEDMDVVNMSLGTHEVSPALATAVTNASAAGLLMVAAAGNIVDFIELFQGCPVSYPGAYPEVLSTTFTNPSDALTGFSCTGPQVDFGSPGDGVFSPVPVGSCMLCAPEGYSAQSGTSMASPHLAGTVALLLDAGIADTGPAGLFDDIRARLCSTADVGWGVQSLFGNTQITPSDPRYPNWFGCGILDADEAVLGITPPVNSPPSATDDTASTPKDTAADIDVLGNDFDPDGDPLTVMATTDPVHGTTTVNLDGTIHYVPDGGYTGLDSFDYTIDDGQGATDDGFVTVAVTATNTPPVATDDAAGTTEDNPVDVAVLANDTDADGDTLAVSDVTDPAHGTTSINPNGTVHYVPDPDYAGPDAFDYTASDVFGGSDTGLVTVQVSATNDPPVAVDDSASTNEDVAAVVAVLANDTDVDGGTLSVTGVSGATNGTATVNPNGTVRFAPTANASGSGSFQYSVSDGAGGSDTGAATVTINPVNDAPVAVNDTATTGQGVPVTISVLSNDTDIDGGSLSIAGVSDPPHGTAVANGNGSITYTPDAGYSGADAFAYAASDGSATSNLATVSITVTAGPPPNPFHLGDLDGSASNSGKTWTARVNIRAHDGAHGNVSGVVLTGVWSNGATGAASCTTAANGTCTVQKTKLSQTATPSVTFTVTAATRSGWTYIATLNHDPDPDSIGTLIVVSRP